MRTAFINTLCELAGSDARIWLLAGDLGYSVLERFQERFPQRYVNVGVAEQNLIGIAAGLASCGKIVFTYSIANFPTIRCLEQIRNDVCYHNVPVKIVAVGGGYAYGAHGYTHHALEDLAVMRALPNLTVVAPGDPVETSLATRALANTPGPSYLRLGKARETTVHAQPPDFAIGRAICVRKGRDVTLISTGGMLAHCMEVATRLSDRHQVQAQVLSMHTLKPLDAEAVLAAVRETGGIVTAEEHSVTGGLGAAVAEVLAALGGSPKPFRKFAAPDCLNEASGSQTYLRDRGGTLYDLVLSVLQENSA